jgi:hypothetical protein
MNDPKTTATATSDVGRLDDEAGVTQILVDTLFGLWATIHNLTRLRPAPRCATRSGPPFRRGDRGAALPRPRLSAFTPGRHRRGASAHEADRDQYRRRRRARAERGHLRRRRRGRSMPAYNKWFTRVVVAAAVIDALASLKLEYPKVSPEKRKDLLAAKRALPRKG